MKHLKRFSALMLTLGVICSAMSPAGAAVANPMNRLSDHAGMSQPIHLIVDDGETVENHFLTIDVPADATKGEELELIETASKDAAGMSITRRAPVAGDIISTQSNFEISTGAMVVGEGRLGNDYNALMVTFDDVTARNGASALNVRVGNNHYNDNSWAWEDIRLGTYTLVILRTNGNGSNQGGDRLYLNEGDYITVWSSVDSGRASVGTVYVSAGNY